MKNKKYTRIYVCHTYYHTYISFLKELALPKEQQGSAHIVLSKMSNDFGDIDSRILSSGVFEKVFWYDEKREENFPELTKYKINRHNLLINMIYRIIFTKKFSKLQEPFVPVDFRQYDDIYVFCDADPIGWYLSGHKIYYHAIEDGLDCFKHISPIIHEGKKAIKLKIFLSDKLNLIFIREGFNKYCLDMEINEIVGTVYPCKKFKEMSRSGLTERLTADDCAILISVFIKEYSKLEELLNALDLTRKNILILTEPLCDLETRKKIFRDLFDTYSREGNVFFKPHPRDELDYAKEFSDVPQFDSKVPMEILNILPHIHFNKIVSVFTSTSALTFADETLRLGEDFMDKYEDPAVHRKAEYFFK